MGKGGLLKDEQGSDRGSDGEKRRGTAYKKELAWI